ncbi:MAG TPA: hypothetical protein VGG41_20450 [Solirubrobacteraceae bacterium]|jgi:hypothetical protein
MTTEISLTRNGQRLARRVLLTATTAAVVLAAGASSAMAAPPNPAANIPAGALPAACTSAPRGALCIRGVVSSLDRARAQLGLGPYLLPADFARLSGSKQLLVLSNLDRVAYGLPPINGLSPVLNRVAAAGVDADADPDPSALLHSFSSFGWSSNWAGAYPNAPEAYYAWMYFDGWSGNGTSNLDCTGPTATGCWGHREDVLSFPALGMLTMGASVSRDAHGQIGYAMTLVWTPTSNWTSYTYSWTQAEAAGAGAGAERTASPKQQTALARNS